MKQLSLILLFATAVLTTPLCATATTPLYVVNGEVWSAERVAEISPELIEQCRSIAPTDEVIARYGNTADNGVIEIRLTYDTPPRFEGRYSSLADYVAATVDWDASHEEKATVSLRYKITHSGNVEVVEALESTDLRLKRRILKSLRNAHFAPATKSGQSVETEHTLSITLPRK